MIAIMMILAAGLVDEAPVLSSYRDDPPTADGRKVIIADTDHVGGGDQYWVWKAFTRGMNPIYMDTRDVSDARREGTRKAMGYTLAYANKMDLALMTPRPELVSTSYCLASPGTEYLVYQPRNGESFSVELRTGTYHSEWFNPATGLIASSGNVHAEGGEQRFKAPFTGEAVLYLKVIKE
jgi:hypothetical protein